MKSVKHEFVNRTSLVSTVQTNPQLLKKANLATTLGRIFLIESHIYRQAKSDLK